MASFTLKKGVRISDIQDLHPNLIVVLGNICLWCKQRNLPVKITSIKTDSVAVRRVSHTHDDGRAFDMSLRGWDRDNVIKFESYFNLTFRHISALSSSDLQPRLVVIHEVVQNGVSYGEHAHIQVKPT